MYQKFPGGPVVRTQNFNCRGPGSIPGRGTEIPLATRSDKKQTNKKQTTTKNPMYRGIGITCKNKMQQQYKDQGGKNGTVAK